MYIHIIILKIKFVNYCAKEIFLINLIIIGCKAGAIWTEKRDGKKL